MHSTPKDNVEYASAQLNVGFSAGPGRLDLETGRDSKSIQKLPYEVADVSLDGLLYGLHRLETDHVDGDLHKLHYDVAEAAGLLNYYTFALQLVVAKAPEFGIDLTDGDGLNPPGSFTSLKLKNVVKYNNDCSRFDFAFEDPKVVSNIPVSSTCVVRAPKEKPLYEDEGKKSKCPYNSGKNQEVYRSYTPVTARGSVGILSFVIKKQRQNDEHPGKMSHYIHSMEIGDTLEIMGYLERAPSMIPWKKNKYDAVTMIAGGVGLTPLLQILEYSLDDENNTKFGHFEVVYVLSDPPLDWPGEKGRIDAALVKKYAAPPNDPTLNVLVCVSGPPAMLEAISGLRKNDENGNAESQGVLSGVLKELGYAERQ
ncbi:hypothetical protein BT96DRAFT_920963, partial [Gymnopus androsaceus JB14]